MAFGGNFDKNERVVVPSTGIGAFNRVRRDSLGDTFMFSSFCGYTSCVSAAVSVDVPKELLDESVRIDASVYV